MRNALDVKLKGIKVERGTRMWEGRVVLIPLFKALQCDALAKNGEMMMNIR